LPGHEDDPRTVDNLVNGENETWDDKNMWLAPYLLERRDEGIYKTYRNEIIINFDLPQIISCIKFWNYTKTPERGAREIEIHVDDTIIFRVRL
jgi:protein JBTS26